MALYRRAASTEWASVILLKLIYRSLADEWEITPTLSCVVGSQCVSKNVNHRGDGESARLCLSFDFSDSRQSQVTFCSWSKHSDSSISQYSDCMRISSMVLFSSFFVQVVDLTFPFSGFPPCFISIRDFQRKSCLIFEEPTLFHETGTCNNNYYYSRLTLDDENEDILVQIQEEQRQFAQRFARRLPQVGKKE